MELTVKSINEQLALLQKQVVSAYEARLQALGAIEALKMVRAKLLEKPEPVEDAGESVTDDDN